MKVSVCIGHSRSNGKIVLEDPLNCAGHLQGIEKKCFRTLRALAWVGRTRPKASAAEAATASCCRWPTRRSRPPSKVRIRGGLSFQGCLKRLLLDNFRAAMAGMVLAVDSATVTRSLSAIDVRAYVGATLEAQACGSLIDSRVIRAGAIGCLLCSHRRHQGPTPRRAPAVSDYH